MQKLLGAQEWKILATVKGTVGIEIVLNNRLFLGMAEGFKNKLCALNLCITGRTVYYLVIAAILSTGGINVVLYNSRLFFMTILVNGFGLNIATEIAGSLLQAILGTPENLFSLQPNLEYKYILLEFSSTRG